MTSSKHGDEAIRNLVPYFIVFYQIVVSNAYLSESRSAAGVMIAERYYNAFFLLKQDDLNGIGKISQAGLLAIFQIFLHKLKEMNKK